MPSSSATSKSSVSILHSDKKEKNMSSLRWRRRPYRGSLKNRPFNLQPATGPRIARADAIVAMLNVGLFRHPNRS